MTAMCVHTSFLTQYPTWRYNTFYVRSEHALNLWRILKNE